MLVAAVQQIPPQISMAAAREEAEMVLFESVAKVLKAARVKPNQVRTVGSEIAREGLAQTCCCLTADCA